MCCALAKPYLGSGLIITSALMIWKTLILLTGSESPVSSATLPRSFVP